MRTRKVATTAVLVALSLLGGHPETAGHCLLVAAAFGLWCSRRARGELAEAVGRPAGRAGLAGIGAAYVLGGLVAAAQLAPFAEYLARSQAWPERARRVPPAWRFRSPAIQNTPALALPYVYGSYRRGHPHVEKFIGAGNFNEIAGGYTGLMTLVVLVPLGCTARRRHCWLRFFIVLDLAALAVAYRLPLVDNLVRAVPLLRVTSNERLLLMVALCHCLLGGAALDNLPVLGRPSGGRLGRVVCAVLVAGAAVLLVAAAVVGVSGDWLSRQARGHYAAEAAARGLPPDALQSRAARMAARTVRFFPRYYALSALYCLGLAGGVWLIGRWYRGQWAGGDGQGGGVRMGGYPSPSALVAGVALAITVVDLFWFGFGYNPAIGRRRYFPTCPTLAYLAGQAGPFRVLPLDEEFPPNLLAAYGLADVRNYDALELRSVLRYFRPLWPPRSGKPLTSNCWTPWPRVAANLDRLRAANVRYMISATEAPPGLQGVRLVHRSGTVRLYELPGARLISGIGDGGGRLLPVPATMVRYGDGRIEADVTVPAGLDRLVVAESFMPGWTASVDGRPAAVSAWRGAFLELAVPAGRHRVVLEYRPGSFRLGLALSVVGLAALVGLACLRGRERV